MANAFKYGVHMASTMETIELEDTTPIWPVPKREDLEQRTASAVITFTARNEDNANLWHLNVCEKWYWWRFFNEEYCWPGSTSADFRVCWDFPAQGAIDHNVAVRFTIQTRPYTQSEYTTIKDSIVDSLTKYAKQVIQDLEATYTVRAVINLWMGDDGVSFMV